MSLPPLFGPTITLYHLMNTAPVNDGIAYQPSAKRPKLDQPSVEPTERHDEFYISDSSGGVSIFLVENTLYKVHRFFFARESSVFRAMFDCPHPEAGQDGESDDKPIRLPGISCSEFEAMLDFFYNGMFFQERKKSECNVPKGISQAKLYDLLSISLRYEFDRVTKEVVSYIDDWAADEDPVTKMCFGLAHDSLRYWVKPAYNALVERDHFLTRDEIIRLGAGRTAIVGATREKIISQSYKQREAQVQRLWGVPPLATAEPTKSALEVPPDFYSE